MLKVVIIQASQITEANNRPPRFCTLDLIIITFTSRHLLSRNEFKYQSRQQFWSKTQNAIFAYI